MKSIFAIKKDILLRIIEASKNYERPVENGEPIDLLVEGSVILELLQCGYIIRLPKTDIPTLEWKESDYAYVNVLVLPKVKDTFDKIMQSTRIDDVHIRPFAPFASDIAINDLVTLKAVGIMHIRVMGDIYADMHLQATILRTMPYEMTLDAVVGDHSELRPAEVVGITANQVVKTIDTLETNLLTLYGVSIVQTTNINDEATLDAAVTSGITLIKDVIIDLHGVMHRIVVYPFNIKQNHEIELRFRMDPRQAKYMKISQLLSLSKTPLAYDEVCIEGLQCSGTFLASCSGELSVNRSALWFDYAECSFEEIENKTFSELRRITV